MNFVIWILAIVFLLSGFMKLITPKEKLVDRMSWVDDFSENQIRLIGVLEILGALGLVLPGLLGILPWLTPLAAIGLALTMVGTIITHMRRKEYRNIFMNVILLLVAVLIAFTFMLGIPL